MSTPRETAPSFGATHFGAARLGDVRRTRRLVQAADAIVHHPGGTLPEKLHDPAALNALYRLANHKAVTHQAVLQPHRQLTLQRMRDAAGPVLVIHDTTELDYTTLTSLTGLGPIGNGSGRGYQCHNALAVDATSRTVLGLVNQILFRRDTAPKGESRQAKRRRQTRETRLWRRGSEAVGPAPAGAVWVDACDRGADTLEYIDYKHQTRGHFIVRSKSDRVCLVESDGAPDRRRLHGTARRLEPLGGKTVAVPARDGQPPRRAKVVIAAAAVRLVPPRQPRGEHGRVPVPVQVVVAREVEAPAEVKEPLEWILLTDLPAGDLEQAGTVTDWYACRGVVEERHKGMKTGCGVERLQFTTEDALRPVIALLSVVAVFLLGLRDASRDPERASRPAREFVPLRYVEVLSRWRHGAPRPDWTVREFLWALGRLGGHQNRPSGPPPGWLVLWRGWTRLDAMLAGAAASEPSRASPGEAPGRGS